MALGLGLALGLTGASGAEVLEPTLWIATNRPVASADLPEVTFPLFRVFGALALVLALFVAGAWLFRHGAGLSRGRARSARLRVLEMRPLGSRHALFVVGYDEQRMLVASSPAGITLLDRLPAEPSAGDVPLSPPTVTASGTPTVGSRLGEVSGRPGTEVMVTESRAVSGGRTADRPPTFAEALRDLIPHA